MTNIRAIELLKIERECVNRNNQDCILCDRQCDKCDLVQSAEELLEMYDFVIDAMEKQIPKKWQYEMVNDDDTYVCPCCKEYWYLNYGNPATNEYNYCPNCGQALEWE